MKTKAGAHTRCEAAKAKLLNKPTVPKCHDITSTDDTLWGFLYFDTSLLHTWTSNTRLMSLLINKLYQFEEVLAADIVEDHVVWCLHCSCNQAQYMSRTKLLSYTPDADQLRPGWGMTGMWSDAMRRCLTHFWCLSAMSTLHAFNPNDLCNALIHSEHDAGIWRKRMKY